MCRKRSNSKSEQWSITDSPVHRYSDSLSNLEHGNIVICTFISPFQIDRDFARSLLPDGRFFEIYVDCDIETAKTRDPKGLYEPALKGEIKKFTGISSQYEKPDNTELVLDSKNYKPEELVDVVYEELYSSKILR